MYWALVVKGYIVEVDFAFGSEDTTSWEVNS